MPKRLIVCADGTWNTPDQDSGGVPAPTNVWRLYQAAQARLQTSDGWIQTPYYHPGVGTAPDPLAHLDGGAFGDGIDNNIKDCYTWLVQNYVPQYGSDPAAHDEIYLFGFSRGAYTVRSLAGLIRKCGLLRADNASPAKVAEAYEFYRTRGDDNAPTSLAAQGYRTENSIQVRIRCVGVWDTVGALGIPVSALKFLDGDRYNFHDVTLSSWVDYAFHALAIDERRVPFQPTLFEPQGTPGQTISQVWFAGVHSNIGGGYADTALSDLTFLWMQEQIATCGIELDPTYVTDHICHGDCQGILYDSMTPYFRILGEFIRPIAAPRTDSSGNPIDTKESLHESVLGRQDKIAPTWNVPYDPPNLQDYLKRHPPPPQGKFDNRAAG